jgi:PTS system fructose-specific IIC component
MKISRHLNTEAIDLDLQGESEKEVLGELARLLCSSVKSLKFEAVEADLIERETLLSTASGHGLAFPHCYEKVKEPVFALGVHKQGVEADAPDGKPVHIYLVVVSPENKPELHLEALSTASRVFMNETVRKEILAAETTEQVIAIISTAEEQQND